MILAAYMVVGFTMVGVYAVGMLRGRLNRYHKLGFTYPFVVAAIAAPLQLLTGDRSARGVASAQPQKFAAMELVATTHSHVTEWIGGIYQNGHVYWGIGVPDLDSILVGSSPDTTVVGWDAVPPDLRAPFPSLLHIAFDLMVGTGTLLLVLVAWQAFWSWRRRRLLTTRWFLLPMAAAGALAILAMESGWIVTEVGRQPWTVYGYLKTADAVTPVTSIGVTLVTVLILYLVLAVVTIGITVAMGRHWRRVDESAAAGRDGPPPRPDRLPRGAQAGGSVGEDR